MDTGIVKSTPHGGRSAVSRPFSPYFPPGRFWFRPSPALLFFLVLCSLGAQNFKPFTALRVIRTAHFEIIYPRESESTARSLALQADGIYERVSGLLGIYPDRRVPVTITPHTDEFNGYMNPLPYPHIVLFDTPMDPEWTVFANSLEGLFLHELTHAVSLSSRGPFLTVLHRIFGGWVYPAALTAPLFMVEGVTVSFESLDGFGRARDPLIKERLRQAVYEDAFLTPFQAAGVYDLPPAGSAYYEYGGLFSAYLQEKYGMEKYAELWRTMGRSYYVSLFFYNHGFFHIFQRIYGLPFPEAWDDFKESLRIWTIEENAGGLAAGGSPLRGGRLLINGTASGGGRVFILDGISRQVRAFDPASGKTERVISVDSSAYAIASSADGGRLLVSSYRYAGALARAVVTEYDARRGRRTGRIWEGLYHGRYFRDGVIGLSSTGHVNNIVFRSASGEEERLLRGNAECVYASPDALDDKRFLFIAAKKGKRELCLYNYETGAVYTLGTELEDDEERWRYIRSLRVSGDSEGDGRVLFGFNHDGRMYKLGWADLTGLETESPDPERPGPVSAGTVVFTERDFSGGVFLPVIAGGAVYYRGAFAAWDALMRYPGSADALPGIRAPLFLRPWDGEELAAALPVPDSPPAAPVPAGGAIFEARRYFPLAYLNPLKLWLPVPLLRSTRSGISLDGGGIFSFMADPTDTNLIFLTAFMDARSLLAAGEIRWTNLSWGFPLEITVADNVDRTRARDFRRTEALVSAGFSRGLGNERRRLRLSPGFGVTLFADDPGTGSAYTWHYEAPYYSLSLGAGFSTLRRFAWELFGQGVSLDTYTRFEVRRAKTRVDGVLSAALEPLPLRLTLYGAWDEADMNLQGKSGLYSFVPFSAVAPEEYSGSGLPGLRWLGGGEAEVKIFMVDLQRSLSHLYFNRFYGTLAYRGAFFEDPRVPSIEGNPIGEDYRLVQSLVLRLGTIISIIPITVMPVKLVPYFWGAWRISNTGDGKNNDFAAGFNFSLEF
ncbi:MAG: hypothetical protein LBP32_03000 [Spirochaetaceae bacterium]|jgi:hypothetical protein|nr:hypothetical protein [Spirochaetaceae bacterium]